MTCSPLLPLLTGAGADWVPWTLLLLPEHWPLPGQKLLPVSPAEAASTGPEPTTPTIRPEPKSR